MSSDTSLLRPLYRRPSIGLAAFSAGLLGQWFRHAAFPAFEGWFGAGHGSAFLTLGLLGFLLVWWGIRDPELPATWKGYLGGLFIWIGWIEFGFHYFAEVFAIPPYQAAPHLVSTPDLNLVQASFPFFIGLFLLYGLMNRQSKCNLMRWIHRNLRIDPGPPVAGFQRNYARVTAMETIFIIWFCYAIWLFILYFGGSMRLMAVAYVAWFAWFLYIFWRLMKASQPAHALRYGIAVGIVAWPLLATPSHMGLFPVIWLRPFDFPGTTLAAVAVFVGAMALFATVPRRGPQKDQAAD